jgi:hypothetical protein
MGAPLTRKHLYEAATTLLTRTTRFSRLKAWGLRLAKASGFRGRVWQGRASSPSSCMRCGEPDPLPLG